MASDARQSLLSGLRRHLVPALEALGFSAVPLSGEDAGSSEIRQSFPLGRWRRAGPRGHEMVEVQLDKHKAAFRLNMGWAPPGGIQHVAGPVPQNDVWVHYLNDYYELYRSPMLRWWFAVPWWKRSSANADDYDALAAAVSLLMPEIDKLLAGQGKGPHVRHVK